MMPKLELKSSNIIMSMLQPMDTKPGSIVRFLIGMALITLFVDIITSTTILKYAVPVLLIVALVSAIVDNRKRNKGFSFATSREKPQGAHGLILIMSPLRTDPQLKDGIDKILRTDSSELSLQDFEDIGVSRSNMLPNIKAVEYHFNAGMLDDVWIITSKTDENMTGSEEAGEIFKKYLQVIYPSRPRVHIDGLCVSSWRYDELWEVVDRIYRKCGRKAGQIIADVTGGNKMMSVAVAMACVDRYRHMQYMESKRDWRGEPIEGGPMQPVLVDFDPKFYSID